LKMKYIYWNLHKKCFSIMESGIVIKHASYIVAKNVEFRVRDRGRQRVINEKRKNVHAFVVSDDVKTLMSKPVLIPKGKLIYNPYKHKTFVYKSNGRCIANAKTVYLTSQDGCPRVTVKEK